MNYELKISKEYPQLDVYENPIEGLWKNILANSLQKILSVENLHMSKKDIFQINKFIERFNSLFDVQSVFLALDRCIKNLDPLKKYTQTLAIVRNTNYTIINDLLEHITNTTHIKTPHTSLDIGKINNQKIFVLDKTVKEFSQNQDYLGAVGSLLCCEKLNSSIDKLAIFNEGFTLSTDERRIIQQNIEKKQTIYTNILEILLFIEKKQNPFHNLKTFEMTIDTTHDEFLKNLENSTKQVVYFLGKMTSVIAHHISISSSFEQDSEQDSEQDDNIDQKKIEIHTDPIKTFLCTAGIIPKTNEKIISAFKKITLSHIAHGMSPAEIVGRIAGSVRTSFPIALLSCIGVRGGIHHGGALKESMKMLSDYCDQFINSLMNNIKTDQNEFVENYVTKLFKTGVIYGFGHRIHKNISKEELGISADPRAVEYFKIIKETFTESHHTIIISMAEMLIQKIKQLKPTLRCNSDFVIGLFCILSGVQHDHAGGLFLMCRLPGLCARIVRELRIKPNSRRSPFPTLLPYLLPSNHTIN